MNRTIRRGLCLVALAAGAASQETPPAQLHDELRALAATMEKAINTRDIGTIVSRVTDDVVFTTMNGDVVTGRDAVRAYFTRMMEGPDRVVEEVTTHFEPDDLSVLLDDHTAVAFGSSDDHYVLAHGPSFDMRARWSGTMVRRDGRWDVASFHYSANVFENPILDAQRRLLIQIAVAAVLVAAFVAHTMGRRRKPAAA